MSKPTAPKQYLRIGQIAERSGVSAKALRLYEQRGLLKPCSHSEAGYRMYGPDALRRLMQIVVLKRSGFTLAEIAGLLSSQEPVIATLLGDRIKALQREMADKTQALKMLQAIALQVDSASTLNLNQLLESITMTSKAQLHATDSQREAIRLRAETFRVVLTPDESESLSQRIDQSLESLSVDDLEAMRRPWRELCAEVRAKMDTGTPASDASVGELARRWHTLVTSLTDRDPNFVNKIRDLYVQHPELMVEQSMSPKMIDYMSAATTAVGLSFAV
jgi:DNA-binding transcriptional MerR regulator